MNATKNNPLSPATSASDTEQRYHAGGAFAFGGVAMASNSDNPGKLRVDDLAVGQSWRDHRGDTWVVDWVCVFTDRAAWTVRFTAAAELDDETHAGRASDLVRQLNANHAAQIGGAL